MLSEEKRQMLSVIKDTAAVFLTLKKKLKLPSGSWNPVKIPNQPTAVYSDQKALLF